MGQTRLNSLGLSGGIARNPDNKLSDPIIRTLVVKAPYTGVATEVVTTSTLTANASIIDIVANVTTASTGGTTQTIDVGVSGNPDQLIDGGATTATGYVGPTGGVGEGATVFTSAQTISYAYGSADLTGSPTAEILITYIGED